MSEYIKKVLEGVGSTVWELPCRRPFPTVSRSGFRDDYRGLSSDSKRIRRVFVKKAMECRNGKPAK